MCAAVFHASERVVTRLSQGSPVGAFVGAFLLAMLLIIASLPIGVGFYAFPLDAGAAIVQTKQVGYVWALN